MSQMKKFKSKWRKKVNNNKKMPNKRLDRNKYNRLRHQLTMTLKLRLS